MDMELKAGGPLFTVRDMERALAFYRDVLGLEVVHDFGANVVLTGGLSLQTLETWAEFLDKPAEDIRFGGNGNELPAELTAVKGSCNYRDYVVSLNLPAYGGAIYLF